jgi:NAD-dependent SIR2 family protein deacetylase
VVELEERTLEQLPDRCQSCGTVLTDSEKRAALEDGDPVLCSTCAAESSALPDEEGESAL